MTQCQQCHGGVQQVAKGAMAMMQKDSRAIINQWQGLWHISIRNIQ